MVLYYPTGASFRQRLLAGFAVVLICCNIGLNTRGGPREIGASVTRAVVTSLILILVLDYFVTKALM